MNLAYQYGANQIWIVNVGDLKPMEIPIEFFLRMAWNPETLPKEKIGDYTLRLAERNFGKEHAAEIADLIAKYGKYSGWRKPELLEPGTFSLTSYREAERVSQAWNDLVARAEKLGDSLPAEQRDGFYQLVTHQAKAVATVVDLYIAAGRNQLYAKQGRASANAEAARVNELFSKDQAISDYYNKTLAGGKWSHLMDQTHIGYTGWQEPRKNQAPKVTEIAIPATSDFGVAIDGSAEAWPGSATEAVLPPFDSLNRQRSYIDVFAKGSGSIEFKPSADKPWIVISEEKTAPGSDRRLNVDIDWQKAPVGAADGTITIAGGTQTVTVKVNAMKATADQERDAKGYFGGLAGPISIAAEGAVKNTKVKGIGWEKIPDYGRGVSGVSIFPVTSPSILPPSAAPCLEYPVYIAKAGNIDVDAIIGPSLNFVPDQGVRLAVSLDDQPPQVLTVIKSTDAAGSDRGWNNSVKDNARTIRSTHAVSSPGRHTLKVSMVDPGVVLQKLILHQEKLPPSYFGPPEGQPNGK